MTDAQEATRDGPLKPGGELDVESILTTHRILSSFGRDPRSLEILHADLFDSRIPVVLSALQAVAGVADRRSFSFVARLAAHPEQQVVCAAVRAAGAIGAPEALPFLVRLSRSARQEAVQLEVLRALARAFPDAPEARELATAISRSVAVQPETAAAAREELLRLVSLRAPTEALELAETHPDALPFVFQLAKNNDELAAAVLRRFRVARAGHAVEIREALIRLAAPLSSDDARSIFLDSLADESPTVRREGYRHLGRHPAQVESFDPICRVLLGAFEQDASMEEEALQALDAMDSCLRSASSRGALPSLRDLRSVVGGLFEFIVKAIQPEIDVAHEMAQQIASAKEYTEFYFNDDGKRTFIESIKSRNDPSLRRRSAAILKDSAVKLEARHSEGYTIMYSLLADPGRPGLPLFLRHLAAADTRKRGVLCRLKRALVLCRLAPAGETSGLLVRILEWARDQRLFRLAELALFALHEADREAALGVAAECLRPPVASNVLAIASLELLGDMDTSSVEPILVRLLHENDRYLRLALLESLASLVPRPGGKLLGSLLQVLRTEPDPQVCSAITGLLGAGGETEAADALMNACDRLDDWKKPLLVSAVGRIARRGELNLRAPATEFLYRVLRAGPPAVLARVPTALIALGDDDAPNVLRDVLPRLGPLERTALIQDLRDDLKPSVIAAIWSFLREPDPGLQQALREVLPLTADPRAQQLLVSMVRNLRIRKADAEPAELEPLDAEAGTERLERPASQRESYRFEREHIRTCAVLFSDIEGYSTKAQELSPIELSEFLRRYEGILIPVAEAHGGTLLKRMGDGHLFVFETPLAATLGAIRIQKALRRHNRFHPERQRVQVRIGIHWGEVVEREGDVFGNTVNVASRLQTAAKGGSTCISREVYEPVAEWIHANDLGLLTVKGLREPVAAWEPTEAALGIPEHLDPLRKGAHAGKAPRKQARSEGPAPDLQGLLDGLSQVFQHLRQVSSRSARAEEAAAVEEEFLKAWSSLEALVASLADRARGKPPPE